MKGKQVIDALGGVSENYVRDSAPKKKRRKSPWIAAVAAVLVVAVAVGIFFRGGRPLDVDPVPAGLTAYAVAQPTYPKTVPYPANEMTGYDSWVFNRAQRREHSGKGAPVLPFARDCGAELLGARQENTVFSPVSAYLAAAMLTELTAGETQAQLLSLLGVPDVETLRQICSDVWYANYCNDGAVTSILGGSVWLGDGVDYHKETLDSLAKYYYAASFSGSFAKKQYVSAMEKWINEQTGDLLQEAAANLPVTPETVMTLLSTVLFRAKWDTTFDESRTVSDTFHALSGDESADYMRQTLTYGVYYWGERFGAVRLTFESEGEMWFFLPDEGVTPDELFRDPEAQRLMELINTGAGKSQWKNQKQLKIHLSLPKFDVSSDVDLTDMLQALGVTDCFHPDTADFTPLTDDTDVFVSAAKHAARVCIDEEGVTAAAFTALMLQGAAMPPEDEMELTLDRPFAFVIKGTDDVPLFMGTVFSVNG